MNEKNHSQTKLLNSRQTRQVFDILADYISPTCELNHENALELLVAVVMSAQATDASVNKVTQYLFKLCKTPQDYVNLGEEKLAEQIKSIGLYRNKAKSVVGLCAKLIADFDGQVPSTREELMTLPGVGRKSANVILNVWFKQPCIAVDTHVFRVANRLALVNETTPETVEAALMKVTPKKHLLHAHHYLLLLGRYTCTARSPHCATCPVNALCPSKNIQSENI